MYTRASVFKHISNLEHVLNKEKSSRLIAVVLPEVEFDFDKEFINTQVHKAKCLNRVSISLDTHPRKQITFCPYCGVMNENTSTAHSHVRKHLGLAYLCVVTARSTRDLRPCTCTGSPVNQQLFAKRRNMHGYGYEC